jgi:hypothetical protein
MLRPREQCLERGKEATNHSLRPARVVDSARIERETGIRRETISTYLKEACGDRAAESFQNRPVEPVR